MAASIAAASATELRAVGAQGLSACLSGGRQLWEMLRGRAEASAAASEPAPPLILGECVAQSVACDDAPGDRSAISLASRARGAGKVAS